MTNAVIKTNLNSKTSNQTNTAHSFIVYIFYPSYSVRNLHKSGNTVFSKSISCLLHSKSAQRAEFGQRDGDVF